MFRLSLLVLLLTAETNALEGISGAFPSGKDQGRRDVVIFSGDTVVPQVVDGGGWKTTFILVNLVDRVAPFVLLFFSDAGTDLPLPIVGIGTFRGIRGTIPIGGSVTLETEGIASTTTSGWAIIERAVNDVVGGMAIFRSRASGRNDSEAVIPIVTKYDKRFVLPFDETNGFVTATAMANPYPSRVDFAIEVHDEGGQVILRDSAYLPPYGHIAFPLVSRYPQLAGKRGVIGFSMNNFGVAMLGLRFNPAGSFTSFNVMTNLDWLTIP